jgi:hypothetical protein
MILIGTNLPLTNLFTRYRTSVCAAVFISLIWIACKHPEEVKIDHQPRRHDFDFLVGSWKLDTLINGDTLTTNLDSYNFKQIKDKGISGVWYFNRGTAKDPQYTQGQYHLGYDTLSAAWSSFFLTDRTARYYQGVMEQGEWWFYYTFYTDKGYEVNQRHVWRSIGPDRMERLLQTIGKEEPKDQWKTFHRSLFSRRRE